jgi:hypothetical protein
MPVLEIIRQPAASLRDNFKVALDDPPPIEIGLELAQGDAVQFSMDVIDCVDHVQQSRFRRFPGHQNT